MKDSIVIYFLLPIIVFLLFLLIAAGWITIGLSLFVKEVFNSSLEAIYTVFNR